MLLNDIGRRPVSALKKINQHLESNYGFKITESASEEDIVSIMETIQDEITDLKIKGDDAKNSPEISKRLLVLEGLTTLREFAVLQLQSPDLEKVIGGMVEAVLEYFRTCGTSEKELNDAINTSMREYRSSEYDFPNDYVEQRVRAAAMERLSSINQQTTLHTEPEFDIPEDTVENLPLIDENDFNGEPVALSKEEWLDRRKELRSMLNNPMLTRDPETKRILQRKWGDLMKAGAKYEQEYMAEQTAVSETKRTNMKEHTNLVKNLRRLLETEVSQAEVMMAAKKFAEELQEMVEKIGRLQNEDLPPVTDQMRETYGTDSASAFQSQIYSAFQGVMDSLYTAKNQVDDAVDNMATTGKVGASIDMDIDTGVTPEHGGDRDLETDLGQGDLDNIADELGGDELGGDEFGGAESEDPLGREMKESVMLKKKIAEMKKLVSKARKLKESNR